MVCINRRNHNGGGVLDSLMKPFTVSKYGQEMHARSLDPKHFLQGYSYVGPRTEILLRDKLGDNVPLNDFDATAKEHDYAYLREKQGYERDHDKQKHIKNVWHADDVFINNAKNSRDDPAMGKIASKLISTKKRLEQSGLMDTKQFSGLVLKKNLKMLIPWHAFVTLFKKEYKTDTKKGKKVNNKKGVFCLP